jgi:hypothetical protein
MAVCIASIWTLTGPDDVSLHYKIASCNRRTHLQLFPYEAVAVRIVERPLFHDGAFQLAKNFLIYQKAPRYTKHA